MALCLMRTASIASSDTIPRSDIKASSASHATELYSMYLKLRRMAF